MTHPQETHRYCGRDFTTSELGQIRALIAEHPDFNRAELSRQVCDLIGWSAEARERNHHLVVNNARYLILPWVTSKNLASKILGRIVRLLPDHWQQVYGYQPLLLETFVDANRFKGTCYLAANWIRLGKTRGRGKRDRYHQHPLSTKEVFVYPLKPAFREILTALT